MSADTVPPLNHSTCICIYNDHQKGKWGWGGGGYITASPKALSLPIHQLTGGNKSRKSLNGRKTSPPYWIFSPPPPSSDNASDLQPAIHHPALNKSTADKPSSGSAHLPASKEGRNLKQTPPAAALPSFFYPPQPPAAVWGRILHNRTKPQRCSQPSLPPSPPSTSPRVLSGGVNSSKRWERFGGGGGKIKEIRKAEGFDRRAELARIPIPPSCCSQDGELKAAKAEQCAGLPPP